MQLYAVTKCQRLLYSRNGKRSLENKSVYPEVYTQQPLSWIARAVLLSLGSKPLSPRRPLLLLKTLRYLRPPDVLGWHRILGRPGLPLAGDETKFPWLQWDTDTGHTRRHPRVGIFSLKRILQVYSVEIHIQNSRLDTVKPVVSNKHLWSMIYLISFIHPTKREHNCTIALYFDWKRNKYK